MAYQPPLLKGKLYALGMASRLGTHKSLGTVPLGPPWVSSGRNRLLLVERLLLCQTLHQAFRTHHVCLLKTIWPEGPLSSWHN